VLRQFERLCLVSPALSVVGAVLLQWLDERIVPTPTHGPRLDHHVCEGAGSRRDIATRVYAAMNEILTSDQEDLVVVTHGFAATFVMAWWIGLPIDSADYVSFEVSPAGISLLVEHDVFRNRSISRLNDTRHLSQVAGGSVKSKS